MLLLVDKITKEVKSTKRFCGIFLSFVFAVCTIVTSVSANDVIAENKEQEVQVLDEKINFSDKNVEFFDIADDLVEVKEFKPENVDKNVTIDNDNGVYDSSALISSPLLDGIMPMEDTDNTDVNSAVILNNYETDRVIILDEGRIIADGSHSQLKHNKEIYTKLFKNQYEVG